MYVLPTLFALFIGYAQFWSNSVRLTKKKLRGKIYSLSAGVSITYLLLELFPFFTEQALWIHRLLFLAVLIGFSAHHLIEKETYLHHSRHGIIKALSMEENIFSYIYHIILGIILATFTQASLVRGIIFLIPIVFFTLASSLPMHVHKSKKKSLLLSTGTLVGVIIATFIPINNIIQAILIGLIIGILLFTITRHHIPFGKHGKPSYFLFGFVVYALIIIASWYV